MSEGQYCITNIAWELTIAPSTPRTARACKPIFIKRKMSKGCQNRGCKKLARHPSRVCYFHAVLEAPVVPPRRLHKKSPAFHRQKKTVACCQNCSLSHCDHQPRLEAIQSAVLDLPSADHLHTVGVRRLLKVPKPAMMRSINAMMKTDQRMTMKRSSMRRARRFWMMAGGQHLDMKTLGNQQRGTAMTMREINLTSAIIRR